MPTMNAPSARNRNTTHRRLPAVVSGRLLSCFAVASLLQVGCVALNIPSERHQDPSDRGGVFGDWANPARPGRVLKEIVIGPDAEPGMGCCDSQHLGDVPLLDDGSFHDGFEGDFGGEVAPPPPEVPWPKYHPLPTRPVFGGTAPRQ